MLRGADYWLLESILQLKETSMKLNNNFETLVRNIKIIIKNINFDFIKIFLGVNRLIPVPVSLQIRVDTRS